MGLSPGSLSSTLAAGFNHHYGCRPCLSFELDGCNHDSDPPLYLQEVMEPYRTEVHHRLLKGGSANWWNHRHFQHHVKPNVFHKDLDVNMLHVFVLGSGSPLGTVEEAGMPALQPPA